ncbi:MAG: type II toxin-antitoxin system VapC family toxin [Candidatus Aenigmarchaeota archaeon]|nr:type II toxin-antitoxin system VapC family toxin [Candidatus Aenigmarchaeota archaeon]
MIFLDTSFIVGYKIENDEHHENAKEAMKRISEGIYGRPVISDYIFDEAVTVIFGKSKKLLLGIETGEQLRNSVEILKIDDFLFEETWEIFKRQKNTNFSFTDCTILSLMKKMKIINLATFDEKFKEIKEINVI